MKKILIFLLAIMVLSCERESKKKIKAPMPASMPVILVEGKAVNIDSILLKPYASKVLKEFYLASGFKSVWQTKNDREEILEQLSNSENEGLISADYYSIILRKLEKKYAKLNDVERAKYDILLTHSFQKYILHLTNGRLNPKLVYQNWDLKENEININETIAVMLKTDSLKHIIKQLIPSHLVYRSLKKALKIINSFPLDTFSRIEIEKKIVPNDTNQSLLGIKRRLIYWKDMKSKDSLSYIYDGETNRAMKHFQSRHGLAPDGVIGKGTIEALNFSKKRRKEQILANLERWKWFPKDMGEEYIVVNIPDYKLTLVRNYDTIRIHKVIVGRDERPTPVLSSNLNYVILNPTWTVPPTILKEDVIPAIAKNRNYLSQTNIKIFDSNGIEILSNEWQLSEAKKYRYVQSPGTYNSLGMVKFSFPNRFSIYLHDTNHRDFFEKQKRSLSSGCVRVDNPLKLAEYLLGNDSNWDLAKITQTLQNEKTKHIKITKEVRIHILYWTAWTEKGTLIFRDDIYNLDAELYRYLGK